MAIERGQNRITRATLGYVTSADNPVSKPAPSVDALSLQATKKEGSGRAIEKCFALLSVLGTAVPRFEEVFGRRRRTRRET